MRRGPLDSGLSPNMTGVLIEGGSLDTETDMYAGQMM